MEEMTRFLGFVLKQSWLKIMEGGNAQMKQEQLRDANCEMLTVEAGW